MKILRAETTTIITYSVFLGTIPNYNITLFIHIPGVQYSIVHIQTRSTLGKKKKKNELKFKRKTTLILVFETSKFGQRHLSATDFH